MKKVPDGEGDWMVYPEGLDDDLDDKYNEDGIGGLDLHRNYLENWRPEPGRDATGRGSHKEPPAPSRYPNPKPRRRPVPAQPPQHLHRPVDGHPHADASPPPSTSKSEERMFEEDLEWYRYFDREGQKITGKLWAGDVYHDYRTRMPTGSHHG